MTSRLSGDGAVWNVAMMTSDKPTAWEQDGLWLLDRRPQAKPEQIEDFCERVSLIWADCKDTEYSRKLALVCFDSKYRGNYDHA